MELTASFGWSWQDVFQQHDVHEFLTVLMDQLPATRNLFIGKSRQVVRWVASPDGAQASGENVTETDFLDLTVPVHGFRTLLDSLQSLSDPDLLSGKNQYAGPSGSVDAQVFTEYVEPPKVLIVHLTRWNFSSLMGRVIKLKDRLEFGEALNFAGAEYRCFAVLTHLGGDLGGHYVAYVCPELRRWVKFDDSRVSFVDFFEVAESNFENAYLLIFVRVDSAAELFSPVSIPDDVNSICCIETMDGKLHWSSKTELDAAVCEVLHQPEDRIVVCGVLDGPLKCVTSLKRPSRGRWLAWAVDGRFDFDRRKSLVVFVHQFDGEKLEPLSPFGLDPKAPTYTLVDLLICYDVVVDGIFTLDGRRLTDSRSFEEDGIASGSRLVCCSSDLDYVTWAKERHPRVSIKGRDVCTGEVIGERMLPQSATIADVEGEFKSKVFVRFGYLGTRKPVSVAGLVQNNWEVLVGDVACLVAVEVSDDGIGRGRSAWLPISTPSDAISCLKLEGRFVFSVLSPKGRIRARDVSGSKLIQASDVLRIDPRHDLLLDELVLVGQIGLLDSETQRCTPHGIARVVVKRPDDVHSVVDQIRVLDVDRLWYVAKEEAGWFRPSRLSNDAKVADLGGMELWFVGKKHATGIKFIRG